MNRVEKNSIYLKQKNFGNIINDFTLTFYLFHKSTHWPKTFWVGVYDCLVMIDSKTLYI